MLAREVCKANPLQWRDPFLHSFIHWRVLVWSVKSVCKRIMYYCRGWLKTTCFPKKCESCIVKLVAIDAHLTILHHIDVLRSSRDPCWEGVIKKVHCNPQILEACCVTERVMSEYSKNDYAFFVFVFVLFLFL